MHTTGLLEREDELAALASARGRCVLVVGPPGVGKTALLEHAARAARTRVLTARGSRLGRFVAFGAVEQLLGGLPDEPDLPTLYAAVAALGDVTIVVDDAHLLDRRSLQWLAYTAERIAGTPLALIVAAESPPRLAEHAVVLEPRPLSPEAVERLGGPRPSAAQRLAALPAACTALARGIAVAGSDGTVAARLAGLDVRGAIEAHEALDIEDFDEVYASIPERERDELHARAARLDPERAAAHLMAGGPGGGEWAAGVLRAAARTAMARGAPDIAAPLLRRAVAEAAPRAAAETPPGAAGEAGPAAGEAAPRATAETPPGAAGPAGAPRDDAGLTLDLGRALVAAGDPAGLPLLRATLDPDARELVEARLLLGDLADAGAAIGGDSARPSTAIALMAAGHYEQAAAVAGTRTPLAVALRGLVRVRQGRAAETEAALTRMLEAEPDLPHATRAWLLAPLVDALLERGAIDEAERWAATDLPLTLGSVFLLDSLARLRLRQGRPVAALRAARECDRRRRAAGIKNPGVIAWGSTLAPALAATGRLSEALDVADEQIDFARACGAAREERLGVETAQVLRTNVHTLT